MTNGALVIIEGGAAAYSSACALLGSDVKAAAGLL